MIEIEKKIKMCPAQLFKKNQITSSVQKTITPFQVNWLFPYYCQHAKLNIS